MKHSDIPREICDWLDLQGISYRNPYTQDALWRKFDLSRSDLRLTVRLIKADHDISSERFQSQYQELLHVIEQERSSGLNSVIIWPDQWVGRRTQVQSRMLALLGTSQTIPARLTILRRITKPEAERFLEESHLQGAVSSRIKYGLFLPKRYYRVLEKQPKGAEYESEWLVAVATFSHPRTFVNNDVSYKSYEMIRFSNAIGTTVVGGLDKLIKNLVREYHPGDLMTYVDLDWSDGVSFRRLGFAEISNTDPVFFVLNDEQRRMPIRSNQKNIALGARLVMNLGSRKLVKSFMQPSSNAG